VSKWAGFIWLRIGPVLSRYKLSSGPSGIVKDGRFLEQPRFS
jgi:hypothetical protein